MSLRLVFSALAGQYEARMREIQRPIAQAATRAMRQASENLKQRARANIGGAGFGRRWQNALRVNVYPPNREVINPAAFLFHKIPYSWVFERGAVIRGRPRLWLPLPGVPRRIGRNRVTPRVYAQAIGRLQFVARPGRAPLLLGQADRGRRGRGKVTGASLRRGGAGTGNVQWVPVFVGITSATLRKRFDIAGVTKQVAAQLPNLYFANLRV